jgi:glucosamine--fructose-6-phosphate aminotransferase (isomerizing)
VCGIFGSILKKGNVVPQIIDGLTRLEYRGYDSMGIAVLDNGKLIVRKDKGKLSEVVANQKINELSSRIGLGHTRWATHGAPNMENAHPHTDSKGNIAVIHNGVIENFMQLKDELLQKGHRFLSRTDTEVIPHLIEEEMKADVGLQEATRRALLHIKGSYAVVIISSYEEKLICARNESPLIIGVSDEGNYCASDVPAILPYTNKVIYLRNGEMATLTKDEYKINRIKTGEVLHYTPETITWTLESAEKNNHPHFMLKEILQQPSSLVNCLILQEKYVNLATTFLDRGKDVFLIGAGTSHHACIAGSYLFSKIARLNTNPVVSSEFIDNYGQIVGADTVLLAVSQSGETYDTLKTIDNARMKAATVIGLTNTVGSSITRISRSYIIQQSGPEIGVAATKTFTSQVLVMAQLAIKLARLRGKLSQDELDDIENYLKKVPSVVQETLDKTQPKIKDLAEKYRDNKLFLFLGRGVSSATALEARLKLLEITYIPSLAYPAGESKHGPISIIEEGVACVFICPKGENHGEIIGSIMEMKARGARIISLCEEGDEEIKRISDDIIEMPIDIPELLSPIPYSIPLQLFAYNIAVSKGLDPDKPRNLAKSVTVP